MEQFNGQLDQLTDYVYQILDEHELPELYSDGIVENFLNRAPYNSNLWSLALRISDYLICGHQNAIANVAL